MKKMIITAMMALGMASAQAFPVAAHASVAHVSVHVAPHVAVVHTAPVVAHPVVVAPHPVVVAPVRPVVVVHPVVPVVHPIVVAHPAVDVCDTLTYNQRVAVNAKAGHLICHQ